MNEDDSSNRVSFQNMSTGTFASVDPSEVRALAGLDKMVLVSRPGIDHDLIGNCTPWLRSPHSLDRRQT